LFQKPSKPLKSIVLKLNFSGSARLGAIVPFLASSVFWIASRPALGQALVPHLLQPNLEQLERQGLSLAREAAQLAQFDQIQFALPRAQIASQLAPNNSQVWALLGQLYLQQNELDKGIAALQRSNSLDRKNAAVLFALGSAYFQKEDYNKAVEVIQAGLLIKPDIPEALFDLGNAYYMLNQFPAAIAQYEKAIQQNDKFWPAINNIGLVKYEQGDVAEALALWQRSITLEPKAAEPQLAVAVALYAQGERDRGIELGITALQVDSRYASLDYLRQNLWGDRLLSDTRKFMADPKVQATLKQLQGRPAAP